MAKKAGPRYIYERFIATWSQPRQVVPGSDTEEYDKAAWDYKAYSFYVPYPVPTPRSQSVLRLTRMARLLHQEVTILFTMSGDRVPNPPPDTPISIYGFLSQEDEDLALGPASQINQYPNGSYGRQENWMSLLLSKAKTVPVMDLPYSPIYDIPTSPSPESLDSISFSPPTPTKSP